MINKINRFHGYSSLNWVYRNGKTVRDPKLSLRYSLNTKRHKYRLAVVVSRKISKSAVVRNRIRRRIYEIVRDYQDSITASYDLVFTIHMVELVDMPHPELAALIHSLLSQAGVLEPKNH